MSAIQVPPIYINGIECTFALANGRLTIGESSAEEGPTTDLVFQCAWADRWNLVQALRGTCVGNITNFVRTAPYALPNNPRLVCTAVGSFGYLGSGALQDGSIYSSLVTVPAHFSAVPWQFQDGDPGGQNDASGQAWTVTKIKPSAEVYQPTGGSYWLGPFSPSTTPLDEAAVGFLRANCEISVTRKFLPCMPLSSIQAALGLVNQSAMQFGDTSFPIGTLLLVASEASEPYFDCVGNPVMDVNFVYLGRTVAPWYKVQDRSGNWQLVNSQPDGLGSSPFKTFEFKNLPR